MFHKRTPYLRFLSLALLALTLAACQGIVATPPTSTPGSPAPLATVLPSATVVSAATAAPSSPAARSTPAALPALVGPEWTILTTGDFDRNGRADVVAYKPAPVFPRVPGSGLPDTFGAAALELVVVERTADGTPWVRLHINRDAIRADNQLLQPFLGPPNPFPGFLIEGRPTERTLQLRLIDAAGKPGAFDLIVGYRDEASAYRLISAGPEQPAPPTGLHIGALTITPSDPAPTGPESGPTARKVRAGAQVTLTVEQVQGAHQVVFFADGRGQLGNAIGAVTTLTGGRAKLAWKVPEGVSVLSIYAQVDDGAGASVTSPPVPVTVTPVVVDTLHQAVTAAIQAKYPGSNVSIQCIQGDFAAAAVAWPGGLHGIGAYLRKQDGVWTIAAAGLGIFREDLIALGFPPDFCGLPPSTDPPPTTVVPPATSYGPEHDAPDALLRAYYVAINGKAYARAYGYWENPPSPSLEAFAQGYSDTASVVLTLGPVTSEGAAGSRYARLPTVLVATHIDGRAETFAGCYVARQTNPDVDPSPRHGKWFLYTATIQLSPPDVTTEQLLAQGCQQ